MDYKAVFAVALTLTLAVVALSAAYIAGSSLGEKTPLPSSGNKGKTGDEKGAAWMPSGIAVSYVWLQNGVRIDLTVSRPDPCHNVGLKEYKAIGKRLYIELAATGPRPGTYCIQVVPPPFTASVFFPVERGVYTLIITVNGKPVRTITVTP